MEESTWNSMMVTVLYTSAGQCFNRHFWTIFSFLTTVSISPVMLPFMRLNCDAGSALMTAADWVYAETRPLSVKQRKLKRDEQQR